MVVLAFPGAVLAQAIQQSGAIVQYHPPAWFSNGWQVDGGMAGQPALSAVGMFNGANCPFSISSQAGPGATSSPYAQFSICETASTATISLTGVNGQANPALYFNVGGVNYPFPGPGGGTVLGPPSSVSGDLACFNGTSGTILSDCGASLPLAVAHGGTGASTASLTSFDNITGFSTAGTTGATSSNLVFSGSPTLTTPNLGTPSTLVLTNATGLPLTTGVTGILPQANGGTGASSLGAGTVTATGTSTALSLASRFARVINVLDEGAVCDGSTDDSAAFTAAFTAAGAGGAVQVPAKACLVNSGVSAPAQEALIGTAFSPGNPIAGSVIECPASLNATCVAVGSASVTQASSISNLTVHYTGTVTSGDTGDLAVQIAGFNSYAQNVMALNAYDGFKWTNGVGSISSHSTGLYTGQILHDHLIDNGFAELYIDNCTLGIDGAGDVASNAFVGITGIDPNTIAISHCQYNLGSSLSPKYWLDFFSLTSQTDGIYSFTSSTLDMSLGTGGFNLGLIHTDSTANLLRMRIHDFTFNAPSTPFFAVNSATILSGFDLEHSIIYSAAFTMPSTSVAYDVHISHNQFFLNAGASTATIATGGSLQGQAFVEDNTFQNPVVYSGSWGTLQTSNNDYNNTVTNNATGNISGLYTTGDGVIANSTGGLSDASAIGTMVIPAPVGSNAAVTLVAPNNTQTAEVIYKNGATIKSAIGYNIFADGNIFDIADSANATEAFAVAPSGIVNVGETGKLTAVLGPLQIAGIVSQCLQTNGSGLIQGSGSACGTGSGASPGGSNTNVQYNNGAAFGGNGGFVYDGTSKVTLGVAGTSVGGVALQNATSGSITLNPPTGALGTVTATVPANTGTIAETNLAQSFTAVQTFNDGDLKLAGSSSGAMTLKAPAAASTFVMTFPSATDTVAGIAATQTLTNKSIAASEINSGAVAVANGGTNCTSATITCFNNITGFSAAGTTGTTSTNLVFSTSPALTTPNLGTPSAAVLTSATGLPLTSGVTGILPIANGGTGVSLSGTGGTSQVLKQVSTGANVTVGQLSASDLSNGVTGSNAVVLASAPTFTNTASITATAGNNGALNIAAPNSSQTADTNYLNGATVESAIGYNIFADGHPLDIADAVNSKEAIFVTSGGVLNLGETSNNVVVTNVPTIGTTANTLCLAAGNIIEQQATSCTVSARRYKKDIHPLTHGLDWVEHLTPSTYEEKADGKKMIGLIADDAGAIDQRLAAYNPDGQIQTIQPEAIIAVLTKALQQQQAEIKTLQAQVSDLRAANDNAHPHRLRHAR